MNFYEQIQAKKRGTTVGAIEDMLSGRPAPHNGAPPNAVHDEYEYQGQAATGPAVKAYDPSAGRGTGGLRDNRPETEFMRLLYANTRWRDQDDAATQAAVIKGSVPPPNAN